MPISASSRKGPPPPADVPPRAGVESEPVRTAILEAALDVFAEHGFAAATVRQITELAGVNVAAVNYYFHSKDGLIRDVLEHFARPIVEARLAALNALERSSAHPSMRELAAALVVPMVELSRNRNGRRNLIRLLLQTRAFPRPEFTAFIVTWFDPVAKRFVDAVLRAMPSLSREAAFWRYTFALGAIMQVLTDADPRVRRLERMSEGLCDTDDRVIATQLVSFIAAGWGAGER